MSKLLEKEGVLKIKGVTIPCYVMKDGTRVLEKKGMEQLISELFKTPSPEILLEKSLMVKLEGFEGYPLDVIADIHKNIEDKGNLLFSHLLEVGMAALVDEATSNDNPKSCDYHSFMDRGWGATESQLSEFDQIMKKALEFNPSKKKNPKA